VSLSLLLPSALAALAALLLPVLIHLSRNSERTLTEFAALRWLDAKLRPRRKLVFQELLLLALRLLLLALVAFYLAQPMLSRLEKPVHWLLVTPGLDPGAIPDDQDIQRRWLAPGFPQIDQLPVVGQAGIASLLREADALLPAAGKLTVWVPERLAGLDGERLQLSRAVDWQVQPGAISETAKPEPTPTIGLAIRSQPNHAAELRYLRGVHSAWQSGLPGPARKALDAGDVQGPLPDKNTLLFWQADGAVPQSVLQWIQAGGTAVLSQSALLPAQAWRDSSWQQVDGSPLLKSSVYGNGRVWQWQRAMTPQAMPELLEPEFPERLQSLLRAEVPAPDRDLASRHVPRTGLAAWPDRPDALNPWLAVLIGLLLVWERWLASAKQRWGGT
jgi:hypothetical protein